MKIPFSPPYIDDQVVAEVTDSLRSGWITTGPKVKALEEEIIKLTGSSHVLCVNSWTTGAIMMLRWLGVKPGDEVAFVDDVADVEFQRDDLGGDLRVDVE